VSCRAEPSGNRHCSIEVWTFVYNNDGEKLITASNRLHTYMTPADYAKMLSGGMAFHQEISVPVKGNYYVRTAIHDMISDRVGAVEVPIAEVAHLDPLQAAVAPPADSAMPVAPTPAALTAPSAAQPATGSSTVPPAAGNTPK
jgi:hypothetical protein